MLPPCAYLALTIWLPGTGDFPERRGLLEVLGTPLMAGEDSVNKGVPWVGAAVRSCGWEATEFALSSDPGFTVDLLCDLQHVAFPL